MFTTLSFFAAPSYAPIVGASAYSYRWQPTAAFDVEPLLGGITMPGYDEFAAVYGSYRVRGSRIIVKMTGIGALGATIIVVPLNADPGATPTAATMIAWRSNPYAKSAMVGNSGSHPSTIKHSMTTAKLFGSNMVETDDSFASLVSTIPTNNWWWAVALYQNFVYAAQPVLSDIQILCDIEFYDRKFLIT
jgi:hypothetical protein